jgi:hypothetical protein
MIGIFGEAEELDNVSKYATEPSDQKGIYL